MKKYVVTIYRCEKDKPRSIVGVAEEVGIKGKQAFTNFDELWEIVNPVKIKHSWDEENRNCD